MSTWVYLTFILGYLLLLALIFAQCFFLWSGKCKKCGEQFERVTFVEFITHWCKKK